MLHVHTIVKQLINVCKSDIEADSIDKDVAVPGEAGSWGKKILTQYDWDWKSTNM